MPNKRAVGAGRPRRQALVLFETMNIDTHEIARRGGMVESDNDFVVVACTKCGAQFLYDEETLVMHFDPQDLRRAFLNVDGQSWPSCPQCGDADWDFANVNSEGAVRNGRWGWILRGS